jgi:hypothetical protein
MNILQFGTEDEQFFHLEQKMFVSGIILRQQELTDSWIVWLASLGNKLQITGFIYNIKTNIATSFNPRHEYNTMYFQQRWNLFIFLNILKRSNLLCVKMITCMIDNLDF